MVPLMAAPCQNHHQRTYSSSGGRGLLQLQTYFSRLQSYYSRIMLDAPAGIIRPTLVTTLALAISDKFSAS